MFTAPNWIAAEGEPGGLAMIMALEPARIRIWQARCGHRRSALCRPVVSRAHLAPQEPGEANPGGGRRRVRARPGFKLSLAKPGRGARLPPAGWGRALGWAPVAANSWTPRACKCAKTPLRL